MGLALGGLIEPQLPYDFLVGQQFSVLRESDRDFGSTMYVSGSCQFLRQEPWMRLASIHSCREGNGRWDGVLLIDRALHETK